MTDKTALPGWNDGAVRRAILEFVRSVTLPGDATVF